MISVASGTLDALKERKRLMDDVWLLTLTVLLVSVGIPWFHRMLDVNLAPVTWSVFGYGCAYVVLSLVAERAESRRAFLILSVGLHAAGVLLLGVMWRLTGGLQNPMFLLVFVLPVLTGSLLLPRWHAYATAALAVGTVTAMVLVDNPALRWYALQLGLPVEMIFAPLGRMPASTVHPFPGVVEPPPYLAVAVFLFGVLMFAVATASGAVGQAVVTLQQRLATLTAALTQAESVSLEEVRLSPWPTALVHADTARVAHASRTFAEQFFVDPDAVEARDLFTLVRFSYPDAVEELIAGHGGVIPAAVCHVRGETRLTRVEVRRLEHAGQRYASVSLLDVTDAQYYKMAVDALETPLIVIDPRGRVRSFNPPAKTLLRRLEPGIEAAIPLRASNMPFQWWALGRRNRQTREVQLGDRLLTATCVGVPIEGEAEVVTIITLAAKGPRS